MQYFKSFFFFQDIIVLKYAYIFFTLLKQNW